MPGLVGISVAADVLLSGGVPNVRWALWPWMEEAVD